MYTRRTALGYLGASLTLKAGLNQPKVETDYQKKVQYDRDAYAKQILASDGPLTGIASFNVQEGKGTSTVGSDPSCSCAFSSGPAHLGDLTVSSGKADLHFAPGVRATVKGQPVTAISTDDNNSSKSAEAELGDLTVTLRYNLAKLRARLGVWDSRVMKTGKFAGLKWFSIDPTYHVIATWTAFPTPKPITFPDSNGESREWKSPGSAEFTLHGQRFSLTPIEDPSPDYPLFFVFGDSTNGHETYGGGRFMHAPKPKEGRVILEFNMATNPMCAYNHKMFVCPAPHRDNRLAIPIPAGELPYPTPA